MGKPKDIELRHDILSSFDAKPVNDLGGVFEHLNKINKRRPLHTIRYVIKAMEKEGLITVIKRGDKNRAYYVKSLFPNATTMTSLRGEPVTLVQFITELDSLDNHPLLKDSVLTMLKQWMFNSIAIADKDAYKAKKLPIPVAEDLDASLNELKLAIELLHRYVKAFIATGVSSELGQRKVLKELEGLGITSVLVDRYSNKEKSDD